MLKIDMHVHTEFSPDAFGSIPEIIKGAMRKGLDGIAITDHNTVDGALKAVEYVEKNDIDFIVIPGIEITTLQGHLLAIGVEEKIEQGMSVRDTLAEIRRLGGLAVAPHPFHPFRNGIWKLSKFEFDAIEVYNAKYIFGVGNYLAKRMRERMNVPETGGSDSHNPEMIGYGFTYVDSDRDYGSIISSLKSGYTRASGEKIPVSIYLGHVKRRVHAEL